MEINRLVLDLSHHETVDSYAAMREDGIVGIIYKATQGTGYKDKTYWTERGRALDAGLFWGSYHFAEEGNVAAQAENYLRYAKPGLDELFCLDLEDYDDNTMTLSQAKEWITYVENKLGRIGQCVVYSGNTLKEMLGDKIDAWWGSRRLWLAQYGNKPEVQQSWDTYWLWQYSDGEQGPEPHSVEGTNDFVDSNSFAGTKEQLFEQWSGQGPTPPLQELVVQLIIKAPPGVKVEVTQVG